MASMADVSIGLQSLKAAFEIGKAVLNLKISADVAQQIGDMSQRILAAQQSALASASRSSSMKLLFPRRKRSPM